MANFLSREDIQAVKDYVMGPDTGFANKAESTVLLHITHSNLKAKFMEIRLDKHMTIEAAKVKLSFHCGTSPSAMMLSLHDEEGGFIASLSDDSRKLGFYSPLDGYLLHVTDTDPSSASAGGWLEDTNLVQKYKMSDDSYNQRENTYRKWKETKLTEDPSWTLEKEMAKRRGVEYTPPAPKITDPDYMKELAADKLPGSRCSVDPGDRRGVVRFVGQAEGLPLGYWVGVQYDEPLGKGDGSVKGKKYFECAQGYGGFVRPSKVKVGDFPPIDDLDDLGDDEI